MSLEEIEILQELVAHHHRSEVLEALREMRLVEQKREADRRRRHGAPENE